jgi:hypothetical protein
MLLGDQFRMRVLHESSCFLVHNLLMRCHAFSAVTRFANERCHAFRALMRFQVIFVEVVMLFDQ